MNGESMDMIRAAGGYRDDYFIGLDGVQRYVMPLFLIVDTSGSMKANHNIVQVRNAIENIKVYLSKHNRECSASVVKVSVLCFDDTAHWEGFMQEPALICPDFTLGQMSSCMGEAFAALDSKLSSEVLIRKGDCVGYKRAVFLLLSDGHSTDDATEPINRLRTNKWFVKGTRIGIAIGEEADTGALIQFTGARKNVLQLNEDTLGCLETVLENVAVVASSTNSRANDLDMQMDFDRCFEMSASATAGILAEVRRKYRAQLGEDLFKEC
ncbi:MAG: hypothetical protein IJ489_06200 [Clostridia bacterium]|nr:hypothetical protein [Clostridia bacterium]